MMRVLKIGVLVIGAVVVGTLLTLRVTGLPPGHPSAQEYVGAGRSARPGLWLTGEVVHEAVTNWDWVNKIGAFGSNASELETRTWYGIPHSVTVLLVARGDKLYLQSSAQTFRLKKKFPYSKSWWSNVERDPRVRLKIDGKIYEMTVALIQDRAEVARLRGEKNPIVTERGADGTEQVTEEWHYWRVFQRNVPEYGNEPAIAASSAASSRIQ